MAVEVPIENCVLEKGSQELVAEGPVGSAAAVLLGPFAGFLV